MDIDSATVIPILTPERRQVSLNAMNFGPQVGQPIVAMDGRMWPHVALHFRALYEFFPGIINQ